MHYPIMIERFVPPVKTLRYESKNEYFKGLIATTKTGKMFVNIWQSATSSWSTYTTITILPHDDTIGTKESEIPVKLLDFKHKNAVLEYFNLKDTDLLCKLSSVVFDGQLFSIGELIVVRFSRLCLL